MSTAYLSCPRYDPRTDTDHYGGCPIVHNETNRTYTSVFYNQYRDHAWHETAENRSYIQSQYHCINHPGTTINVHFTYNAWYRRTRTRHDETWHMDYHDIGPHWVLTRPPVPSILAGW